MGGYKIAIISPNKQELIDQKRWSSDMFFSQVEKFDDVATEFEELLNVA